MLVNFVMTKMEMEMEMEEEKEEEDRQAHVNKELLAAMTLSHIPLIQPGKLVLALLIPFTPSLEVVLIVKPAANGTASRKSL